MRSPRPSPRRLALLGATGSIGRQVCDLVERHPERFALHAVIAGTDAAGLEAVAHRHPEAHALLANPGGTDASPAGRGIDEAGRGPGRRPDLGGPPPAARPGAAPAVA